MVASLIVVIALVDQLIKFLMLDLLADGNVIYVIGDWFRFRLLFNPGAAFSFGTGATWIFTCIQLAFVVGISWYSPRIQDRWTAVGLGLVAGGAAGNLIDRLFREPGFFVGHVVDFISIGNFAVFNIADSAITCGVIVYICSAFIQEYQHKIQVDPDTATDTTEAERTVSPSNQASATKEEPHA
ncbi:MAG: signal peptidase II [Corynebacterium sp.]|nr:signal peptidase II [Corynebacterium sp.]